MKYVNVYYNSKRSLDFTKVRRMCSNRSMTGQILWSSTSDYLLMRNINAHSTDLLDGTALIRPQSSAECQPIPRARVHQRIVPFVHVPGEDIRGDRINPCGNFHGVYTLEV